MKLTNWQVWNVKWSLDSVQSQSVHKTIMDMIVGDMKPLSIVEDQGFQRMVKLAWPMYEIPGWKFFGKS